MFVDWIKDPRFKVAQKLFRKSWRRNTLHGLSRVDPRSKVTKNDFAGKLLDMLAPQTTLFSLRSSLAHRRHKWPLQAPQKLSSDSKHLSLLHLARLENGDAFFGTHMISNAEAPCVQRVPNSFPQARSSVDGCALSAKPPAAV